MIDNHPCPFCGRLMEIALTPVTDNNGEHRGWVLDRPALEIALLEHMWHQPTTHGDYPTTSSRTDLS